MPLFEEGSPDHYLVTGRHGYFLVNRHDCYVGVSLIFYGEYSDAEWDLFSQFIKAGDTAMDIGANIGAFSVAIAKKIGDEGRLYCFEPQPHANELLQINIEMNNLSNVKIFPFGLGAMEESREADLPDYTKTGNFGGVCFSYPGKGLTASFKTLDRFFQGSRLDFIKIDVEGMEIDVLDGGKETLRRCLPVLYLENHPGKKSSPLISRLMDMGYRLWWHTPFYFKADNYLKQTENLYQGQLSMNMLCIPEDRPDIIAKVPMGLLPVTHPEQSLDMGDTIFTSLVATR